LAGFLVLSTYYARTKNLFPPVIAHLAADLRLLSLIR
jgi:membrane protease YdiL (CAAX protease family)